MYLNITSMSEKKLEKLADREVKNEQGIRKYEPGFKQQCFWSTLQDLHQLFLLSLLSYHHLCINRDQQFTPFPFKWHIHKLDRTDRKAAQRSMASCNNQIARSLGSAVIPSELRNTYLKIYFELKKKKVKKSLFSICWQNKQMSQSIVNAEG